MSQPEFAQTKCTDRVEEDAIRVLGSEFEVQHVHGRWRTEVEKRIGTKTCHRLVLTTITFHGKLIMSLYTDITYRERVDIYIHT